MRSILLAKGIARKKSKKTCHQVINQLDGARRINVHGAGHLRERMGGRDSIPLRFCVKNREGFRERKITWAACFFYE